MVSSTLGKKRRVMRSSGPCDQDSRHRSIKGMRSLAKDFTVYAKIFLFFIKDISDSIWSLTVELS